MLIYIVEDDTDIRELESYAMKSSGYEVQSFGESKSFFKACTAEIPQLVILDVMLPDFDGLSVLEKMRRDAVTKNVPVILVTAKGSEMDKVKGLDMGADDYITKPFSITEVMARIKANIRRNTEYAAVQPEQTKLVWGPLVMNMENHTVTKSGEIIELTAKEFDILRLLLENPQRVYTKAQIYSLIWNDAYMGDENAVNVHISRLRTKIEDDPRKPQVVITVWGIGYKLGEQKLAMRQLSFY